MTKAIWRPVRILILAATFLGALTVASRAVLSPKSEVKVVSPTQPMTIVPLAGWQLTTSSPLPAIEAGPAGHQFEYRQATTVLTVEARMMPGDGNISRFLFVHTPIRAANANLIIKQQPGIGYYGILTHKGRAYLSACVNARGESTVTEQQFMQSRYAHDMRVDRVLPWLLGQQPLLDQRCLWTLMSVPLAATTTANADTTDATFKSLETAWFSWYHWWQSRFPPA